MNFEEFIANFQKGPVVEYPNNIVDNPLITVCIQTYQHVGYIKTCLDGILMQQTTFPFEILLGEDASTDGTREICIEYAKRLPEKIKLFLHHRGNNIKINGTPTGRFNLLYNFFSARGRYIALCEGDDAWTDTLKLQKQVEFLEANPEFSFCFHDAMILNQKTRNKQERIGKRKINQVVNLKSVIIENNFSTASIVFRNVLDYSNLPEWFLKTSKGDYGIVVLLAEKGLGKYLPNVMSVYRVHESGVWSGKSSDYYFIENIKFYKLLWECFSSKEIRNAIKSKRALLYFGHGISKLRKGNFLYGWFYIIRYGRYNRDKRLRPEFKKIPKAFISGIKYLLSNRIIN